MSEVAKLATHVAFAPLPTGPAVSKLTVYVAYSPVVAVRRRAQLYMRIGDANPAHTPPIIQHDEPINLTIPVISGVRTVGQTLSTTDGTWLNSPTNFNYQWKLNGTAIFAANFPTYSLVTGDAGGTITVEVTASSAYGISPAVSSAGVTIAAAVSISGTPVLTGTESQTYTGFSVTGAGGVGPYVYSVSSGSLPSGLSLNATTGAVSGTPSVPGAYAGIVLRATDANSAFADLASFTITIAAAATGGGSGYLDYVPVLVL